MSTTINLNTIVNTNRLSKNMIRPWQRCIAAIMASFMLLQICLPTVVIAATMLNNDQFSTLINTPIYRTTGATTGYLYARPSYLQIDTQSGSNITTFYKSLTKSTLPDGNLLIGDDFVQQRLIRSQISLILGRTLIDSSKLLLVGDAKKAYEAAQNDALFAAGAQFGTMSSKPFGTPLAAQDAIANDMIWPEKRTINGVQVVIPVVYLSQATLNTRPEGHQISFGLNTTFNNIEVNKGVVVSAAGNENYTAIIKSINNIVNSGSLTGSGNLNLVAGNTLANLSGKIAATNNLDIRAEKGDVINKTKLIPYQSKDGSGTHFGAVATIDSLKGNLKITSGGNITYEGGTSNSFYGSLTFNADGNIILSPASITSESTTKDGHWVINKSSVELMQSKLTANQMLTLMAGGSISITASELYSTQGGIQLLANHGIYVADEQGQFQSNRADKIGKTRGTGSDFESFAVRSVLSAGKGVLLSTESGDITLKGAKINTSEGTQVKAANGKVHLLVTKENSQHYLDTIRKGLWTIKTVHEEYLQETGISNAIIGGLAVEALTGVDIEYAGREGATLAEQIAEYKKMPDTAWMADVYEGKIRFKDAQGNDVPLDVSKVDLAYKHIREHNTNLSPAAMAIIAICVAIVAGPAAGLIGSGGTGIVGSAVTAAVGSSVAGAVANAAVLTLMTSAAQNLAAGKGLEGTLEAMTSNDALKNLAVSMATAGALQGLDVEHLELFGNGLADQAYQAVVSSVVTSGVSVAIGGGNTDDFLKAFQQSLAINAINTIGQHYSDKIIKSDSISGVGKYLSEAALGCLTSGLSNKLSDQDFKNACVSGASGAAISQALADSLSNEIQEYNNKIANTPTQVLSEEFAGKLARWGKYGVNISKLMAGFAALAFGGDVNAAANSASMVSVSHQKEYQFAYSLGTALDQFGMRNCDGLSLLACGKRGVEQDALKALRSTPSLTDQDISNQMERYRQAGIFESVTAFNLALINNPIDAMELMGISRLNVPVDDNEITVIRERYNLYQETVQNIAASFGALSDGITDASEAVEHAAAKGLWITPAFQCAFFIGEHIQQKSAELISQSENISALLNKAGSEIQLKGAAAAAYLNGNSIEFSLWEAQGWPHEMVDLESKGFIFLSGFVLGEVGAKVGEAAVSGALKVINKNFLVTSTRADIIAAARLRQEAMLEENIGFNISPTSWDQWQTIGLNGTFVSDRQGVLSYFGNVSQMTEITITRSLASKIEKDFGLQPGALAGGFKVRQINGLRSLSPNSPLEGNEFFLGAGNHLPGGAPEMVVKSISTVDNDFVTTILKVTVKND